MKPAIDRMLPLIAAVSLLWGPAADAEPRQVIGWAERISLSQAALPMQAKVDTGADVSSIHADAVRPFVRDGGQWVEFTLHADNGERRVLQRPVTRFAAIKLKTAGVQRRPVVLLEVCVGGRRSISEFNLSQRAHFRYPVLLGRSFLGNRYLVDPASRHLLNPRCD